MTISFRLEIKTIGNENIYSSQHCTHFILLSETWIVIYNDSNCPILENYENWIIRISLCTSHFLQKVATLCSRLLIKFKYNNYIRGKKPISAERKMDVMETQEKGNSNSPFRNFDKFFLYINKNLNIFPWVSNSCGKSRLRKIRKHLRALVILGTRSDISRASTNQLEENTCVFFVTIIFKTRKNIPSIVFRLV